MRAGWWVAVLGAGLLAAVPGCSLLRGTENPGVGTVAYDGELALAAKWLTGHFSSAEQAERDSAYYDIHLHMARIWPERTDGFWLYVEQLLAGHTPYRQRVYHIHRTSPETIESVVYRLPEESRFVDGWRDPEGFGSLTPDSLDERAGCAIVLRRVDEKTFAGSTVGKACPSNLRGASYATSEVTLTADTLISWDRGFNAAGEQVWGAVKGGYVFKRVGDEDMDP